MTAETQQPSGGLDIGAAVRETMASASPAARVLIAQVFEIEKKYQHMSRPGPKLLGELEKAVRRAVERADQTP